jgi:hypothetical protein
MFGIDPGISVSSLDGRSPGVTSNEGGNAATQSSVSSFKSVASRPSNHERRDPLAPSMSKSRSTSRRSFVFSLPRISGPYNLAEHCRYVVGASLFQVIPF